MATHSALMLALTFIGLLLPVTVMNHFAQRINRRKRGEVVSARRAETVRFLIVTTAATAMCGSVLLFGPDDFTPSRHGTSRPVTATPVLAQVKAPRVTGIADVRSDGTGPIQPLVFR